MSPFIRSWVRGIDNCLVDKGSYAPWPTDKIASEVCDRLADSVSLEAIPDAGLSKEAYLQVGGALKTARERLTAAGYGANAGSVLQAKTAASMSLSDRAAQVAAAVMDKVATESLIMQGGQHENTPEAAAAHDQLARLDQKNRPQGTYLVGVGKSEMPVGGHVGKEMAHPKAPGATAPLSNSLTEATSKYAGLSAKEAQLVNLALGKQADETPAGDLGGGEAPGAMPGGAPQDPAAAAGGVDPAVMAKLKMLLQALQAKFSGGSAPSPEAQCATAGLAQHPQGMDVMAQVLDRSKTADEADGMLQEILQHQGQSGQLAAPELIAALEQILGGGGDAAAAGGAPEGAIPPAAAPLPAGPEAAQPKAASMSDLVGKMNPFAKKDAKGGSPDTNAPPIETVNHPATNEGKVGSLMATLKRASEGSLTSVGHNTPESAAKDQQLAELDQKNRSTKEYLTGQGKSKMPNEGQVYDVKKVTGTSNTDSTDTTPSRETKTSSLTAEETEYLEQLQKTAAVYGSMLPIALPENEKIAHLYKIHALVPSARAEYVASLRK